MKTGIHRRGAETQRRSGFEISNQRFLFFSVSLCLCGLILLVSCGKPPESKKSGESAYDPRKDPLVNPKSLFEPATSDLSQVATDDTLNIQLRGSPNTLNPIFASTHYDQIASGAPYEGPFIFDKNMEWQVNESMVESFEE